MTSDDQSPRLPSIVVALLLLLAPLGTGCLGDSGAPSNTTDGEDLSPTNASDENAALDGEGQDDAEWPLNLTANPTFPGVEYGVPFKQFGGFLGGFCDIFLNLEIPENATALRTHLYGAPDTPGTGHMVHLVTDMVNEEDYAPGPTISLPPTTLYQGPPETDHWINVTDPAPGEWRVVTFPHGSVVDQTWTLDIVIDGEGGIGETNLDHPNPFGGDCEDRDLRSGQASDVPSILRQWGHGSTG